MKALIFAVCLLLTNVAFAQLPIQVVVKEGSKSANQQACIEEQIAEIKAVAKSRDDFQGVVNLVIESSDLTGTVDPGYGSGSIVIKSTHALRMVMTDVVFNLVSFTYPDGNYLCRSIKADDIRTALTTKILK